MTVLAYYLFFFFFFNDTATTEIYTLSLHDALPICEIAAWWREPMHVQERFQSPSSCCAKLSSNPRNWKKKDRKSTRLNSSHSQISYAVFCLKKKKTITENIKNKDAICRYTSDLIRR